jgi:predicted enzyme related to lactoylglutathione lyase
MSPATKPVPGSFCWFELATLDQTAAKRFYQSVLGWSVEDQPMGPSEMYSLFRINGKDVAAGYTMRAEQKAQGVPPNWMVYVLVSSVDKSAAKAKTLGATVHVEPFDVMDAGRMSVIQDPVGATFCIWQPNKSQGAGLRGEHGTAVWVDLSTPDQVKSGKFYSDLFGWKMVGENMNPAKPGDYYHIVNGTDFIGGIQPATHRDPKTPPFWLTYFDVADADATVKQVASLGGKVIMPTMAMGDVRKFAVLADPQGAVFALVQDLGGKESSATPKPIAKATATKVPAAKAPAVKAPPVKAPAMKAAARKPAAKNGRAKKPLAKKSAKAKARKATPPRGSKSAKKARASKKTKPAKKGQRKR